MGALVTVDSRACGGVEGKAEGSATFGGRRRRSAADRAWLWIADRSERPDERGASLMNVRIVAGCGAGGAGSGRRSTAEARMARYAA